MSPIRQRFIEELKLGGHAKNTITCYVQAVRNLSSYFGKSPLFITDEELRAYLLHLQGKPVAAKTYNLTISAINRFFQYCAPNRPVPKMSRLPIPFTLPEVLSVEEVKCLLESVTSLKYKTILSLMYSSGLRIGECARLCPGDIDSKRMLVRVSKGKGNKDRFAILGTTALSLLRRYFIAYRPTQWLFEGVSKDKPLHVRSIQNVFREAVKDAGIKRFVRPHTLRHSFATHLLEQKCPLPAIQRFLGHKNISSTVLYTHITPRTLADIVNPLDAIMASPKAGEVHHD